jgi:hypothetical protein
MGAQIDSTSYGNVEIFVIDSYITPEAPYKFSLSFFTSDSVISKLIILDDQEYDVSLKLTDNHKIEIDISDNLTDRNTLKYFIYVYDRERNESKSQLYEVEIPRNIVVKNQSDSGLLQICCLGGVIFGIPSPAIVFSNGDQYFSLTKELPLFSFYSGNFTYPFGYVSAEYAHIFNSSNNDFIRIGYKQIVQLKFIEYLSLGVNYFTNLKGYNGFSPEVSLGLFQIQNTITLFAKYRYNFQPGNKGNDFHELSIGIYSSFFSLNL